MKNHGQPDGSFYNVNLAGLRGYLEKHYLGVSVRVSPKLKYVLACSTWGDPSSIWAVTSTGGGWGWGTEGALLSLPELGQFSPCLAIPQLGFGLWHLRHHPSASIQAFGPKMRATPLAPRMWRPLCLEQATPPASWAAGELSQDFSAFIIMSSLPL